MSEIVKKSQSEVLAPYSRQHLHSSGSAHAAENLDVRRIVTKLFRRKFQILAVALLVLIPASIVTYLATPLYRSSALMQVNPDPVQVLPYRDVADFPSASPYYEVYMKTQEQVLKSPTLVVRVSQRLNSESSSEDMRLEAPYLQKRFEIQRIENSQLFRLSYVAPNPETAAGLVNIFAEEYIKELFQARQSTREKARKLLEGELEGLEERVQASEKELVRYARDNNMISVEQGQVDLVEQRLGLLARQVTDAEAELVVARSRLDSLRKASVENFPERLVTANVTGLTSKVLQLEHELTALRTSFGENWPAVVRKREEIALVRDQLEREKSAVLAQAIEQAELDVQAADSRYRMHSDAMSRQKQLVDRYQNASIQYNILRREVETNQKLYEGLLERLKQTSVTAGLEFGNIHVVEPGRPSKEIDSPKMAWNLGLASLLGLALGVCFALVLDFWDNSVATLEEAEHLTALPALGSLPVLKSAARRPEIAARSGRNGSVSELGLLESGVGQSAEKTGLPPEAAEAVRMICASILLSKSDRPPHIIMVTSATPAEGKTTVVNHLGRAFAESGNKTLMVESDLRKPALSKLLGIGSEAGLSLFLSGHVSPLPKIHDIVGPNLFAIAAGPKAPNPVALLNSEKLDRLLKDMAESFQFVLLDAPPILAVADARVLCTKVDGVVLVVRAGRTPRAAIRRAWTTLEHSGANMLGMVLNGAQYNGYESSYYRYYYQ